MRRRIKSRIYSHSYWETRHIYPLWDEHLSSFGIQFCWISLYLSSPHCFSVSWSLLLLYLMSPLPAPLVCFLVVSPCLWDKLCYQLVYLIAIFRPKTIAPDSSGRVYTATVTFSHCIGPLLKQLNARRTPRGIIRPLYTGKRGLLLKHTRTHCKFAPHAAHCCPTVIYFTLLIALTGVSGASLFMYACGCTLTICLPSVSVNWLRMELNLSNAISWQGLDCRICSLRHS